MLLPLTAATGVTHERISFPSSNTEQAPHCARPHPKRGPCRWSSLCRTYKRGVSRLALTPCVSPFTLILRLLAIRPSWSRATVLRRGRGAVRRRGREETRLPPGRDGYHRVCQIAPTRRNTHKGNKRGRGHA